MTKSRRYSTTVAALRDERQQWRLAQRQPSLADEELSGVVDEVREWSFEGSGYLTIGDACLARGLEEEARLGRWLACEETAASLSSLEELASPAPPSTPIVGRTVGTER